MSNVTKIDPGAVEREADELFARALKLRADLERHFAAHPKSPIAIGEATRLLGALRGFTSAFNA